MNRRYLDPAILGRSPVGIESVYGDLWIEPTAAEFAEMSPPLDWLGLNYYTSVLVRRDDEVVPTRARSVPRPGSTRSLLGWEFQPDDLRRTLVRLSRDYPGHPLMVTENGVALRDPAPVDGVIEDALRVAYLRSHIDAVAQARAAGVDVRGYYAWSLLDNFEWGQGYEPTFGIVGVDRETGARILKRSALAYAEMIRPG
jgi:beta-glucosidase